LPGQLGNALSVQVIEYADTAEAVCVITNYSIKSDEMTTGPVTVEFFDMQLKSNERIEIDRLDTIPRARNYSISFKIAPAVETFVELGTWTPSRLFAPPGKLAALITPTAPVFTPADKITMTPRKRVYRLVAKTATPLPDPVTGVAGPAVTGWDIDDLRAQVNASDPWVEMIERTPGTVDPAGGPPVVLGPLNDAQDRLQDALVLTPFAEKLLSGGDGLPNTPIGESTGPSRSIVHVNYGEAYDGTLDELNVVYEWAGNSALEGSWVSY